MCNSEPENIVTIRLNRGNQGLGFNIRGGSDTPHVNGDTGIFVTKIRESGAAWEDGRLKEGDKIVEINGKSLRNLTHGQAVNIFINAGEVVEMKVVQGAEAKIIEEYQKGRRGENGGSGILLPALIGVGVAVILATATFVFLKKKKS
ncbi:DgyrCDS9777 [Dimorphilus gyrociliatus]|uniref:DgyrCDS9777 n=1 Tax=Dimorphilus gyrociliatus TaxID=2664684 RepID=A0A7I8VXZ9_9ANNE|nr:DgyrCDS9777 [Dimorphilus gyrociliatus]